MKPNPSLTDRLDALEMLDDFPIANRDDWLRGLGNLKGWRLRFSTT
jgi:hypothetical protein